MQATASTFEFSVGMKVGWRQIKNRHTIEAAFKLKNRFGEGPFEISRIEEIDEGHEDRMHKQVIFLAGIPDTRFSGYWFELVS